MKKLLFAALVALLGLIPMAPPAEATRNVGLGVYLEGPAHNIYGYEDWVGRRVDYRLVFPGHRTSWQHTKHSTADILNGPLRNGNRTLVLSLPFAIEGEAPTACDALRGNAWGDPDAYNFYTWLGQELRRLGYDKPFVDGRPRAIIRPAWEMTGPWFPWQGIDCPVAFKALWNMAHYRVGIKTIPWEFSVITDANWGHLMSLLPAPSTFQIVSMSYYDNGVKPENRAGGLPLLAELSRVTGKPMSISESGRGPWRPVEKQAEWFKHVGEFVKSHNVVYVSYFETGAWALRSAPWQISQSFKQNIVR